MIASDIRLTAATDRLGRSLPMQPDVPAPRKDRYVGMFYFVCLDQKGTDGPYDVEKILAQDPTAATDENHPLWGPIDGAAHHWGEPLFGYYFTRDEWVIRKHIEMLSYADVDFLVFDTTNRVIYYDSVVRIMGILSEYIREGFQVPRVAFMTNTKSGETVDEIYRRIYGENLYPETWFLWEGKPLIIGQKPECCSEAQAFFTFRRSQWPNEEQREGGFPWMEFIRPQRVYRDAEGVPEIVNVSLAQHPNCAHSDGAFFGETDAWGRSYHDGHMDTRYRAVDWGFNAQEQWDYAIKVDPKIIFVTGWNEWTAGRWSWNRSREMSYDVTNDFETVHYVRSPRPHIRHTFCDCCNEEYSRDIEPMKGGYFDNYYLQLIANVRRFKGVSPVPVDGGEGVKYVDFPFGNAHRHCRGFGKNVYTDKTGVNDIREMTVRREKGELVFTAKCAGAIVKEGNWMKLLIGIGENGREGLCGFTFLANFGEPEKDRAMLAKWDGGAFQPVLSIGASFEGDTACLRVPVAALGLETDAPVCLRFKWADQLALDGTGEDLYLHGDTAPYGRLACVYRSK